MCIVVFESSRYNIVWRFEALLRWAPRSKDDSLFEWIVWRHNSFFFSFWDWTGGFLGLLKYMYDYVNSLATPANKHFNSLSVKHQFPSQRSRFDSRSGKHPWILFWYSVTVLVIEYCRRCRSCISVKILASAYLERNLGLGWRVGYGGGEAWINSEGQNSRKICPGWILRQERKVFTL